MDRHPSAENAISPNRQAPKERRRNRRRRVLLRAVIIFNDEFSTLYGSVQNISDCGCRIRFTIPPLLPNRFQVQFTKTGEKRTCELVWRSDREIGVRFVDGCE